MTNPIKDIIQFNKDAGLLDNGYNDSLESAFQIEEALEGFDLSMLSRLLAPRSADTLSPKLLSRAIVKVAKDNTLLDIEDVDRLDKHCDGFIYHVGSMAKLGLDYHQIIKALNIVITANKSKIGCSLDSSGKLNKPEGFKDTHSPEPKLQELLDTRRS